MCFLSVFATIALVGVLLTLWGLHNHSELGGVGFFLALIGIPSTIIFSYETFKEPIQRFTRYVRHKVNRIGGVIFLPVLPTGLESPDNQTFDRNLKIAGVIATPALLYFLGRAAYATRVNAPIFPLFSTNISPLLALADSFLALPIVVAVSRCAWLLAFGVHRFEERTRHTVYINGLSHSGIVVLFAGFCSLWFYGLIFGIVNYCYNLLCGPTL